jgi:hypothetical protein
MALKIDNRQNISRNMRSILKYQNKIRKKGQNNSRNNLKINLNKTED